MHGNFDLNTHDVSSQKKTLEHRRTMVAGLACLTDHKKKANPQKRKTTHRKPKKSQGNKLHGHNTKHRRRPTSLKAGTASAKAAAVQEVPPLPQRASATADVNSLRSATLPTALPTQTPPSPKAAAAASNNAPPPAFQATLKASPKPSPKPTVSPSPVSTPTPARLPTPTPAPTATAALASAPPSTSYNSHRTDLCDNHRTACGMMNITTTDVAMAWCILEVHNTERAQHQAPPLQWSITLQASAQVRIAMVCRFVQCIHGVVEDVQITSLASCKQGQVPINGEDTGTI